MKLLLNSQQIVFTNKKKSFQMLSLKQNLKFNVGQHHIKFKY